MSGSNYLLLYVLLLPWFSPRRLCDFKCSRTGEVGELIRRVAALRLIFGRLKAGIGSEGKLWPGITRVGGLRSTAI